MFFVGNIPASGCNPAQLTQFDDRPKDSLNCVLDINSNIQAYREALQQVVNRLQASFGSDGTQIYHFDFYSASSEIFGHLEVYGENPVTCSLQ